MKRYRRQPNLSRYVKVGVLQSIVVIGSLYLSDRTGNPFFGALSIPLTLTTVLALENRQVNSHAHFLGLTLAVYAAVTAVFYLLVARYRISKKNALICSLILWLIAIYALYTTTK